MSTGSGVLRSGRPRSTVEIAFVWISTPDISGSVGVGWMSCSDCADGPMITIAFLKALAGTRPRRTRE